MAKISQIKLTSTTYDIDVASNLKATKIIGEDPIKIPPVEAIQKPDGVNPLFDENNKISSHYVSDTILGQLKFGGTLTATDDSVGLRYYNITESAAFRDRALEISPQAESYSDPCFYTDTITGSITPLAYWEEVGASPLFGNDLAALEGFYFIMTSNTSAMINEVPLEFVPEFKVGDWWVFCNGVVKKIDNTDTITHIDETDYNSLLEITGSSGLKLNGFSRYPDTVSISLDTDLYSASDITTTGTINAGLVSTSQVSASSIDAGEIFASNRMTAPTISDTTDKTQVVNLDYFENNATKVDWENIDSDVRIINGHNFKIQSKYTEQNIGCGMLPSSFDGVEPQQDSSTGQWEWGVDESWTSPYWGYFRIKKNCRYIVKPAKTSGPFNNAECLDSGASVLVAAELSTVPLLELTSEDHDLIYQPSVYDEVSWEPSFGGYIEFKAPIDGFAFFGTSDSFDPVLWVVLERVFEKEASAEIEGDLKVTGDIEVTGDLSFGADSHLVFGTIEGTDFIADHIEAQSIKINGKRVLTEDDLANLVAYPAAEDYTF